MPQNPNERSLFERMQPARTRANKKGSDRSQTSTPGEVFQFIDRLGMEATPAERFTQQTGVPVRGVEQPLLSPMDVDLTAPLSLAHLPIMARQVIREGGGVLDIIAALRRSGLPMTPKTAGEALTLLDDASAELSNRAAKAGLDATPLSENNALIDAPRQVMNQAIDDSLVIDADLVDQVNRLSPEEFSQVTVNQLEGRRNPAVQALHDSVTSFLEQSRGVSGPHQAAAAKLLERPFPREGFETALTGVSPRDFQNQLEAATILRSIDQATPQNMTFLTTDSLLSAQGLGAVDAAKLNPGDIVKFPLENVGIADDVMPMLEGAPPEIRNERLFVIEGPTKFLDASPTKWDFTADVSGTGLPRSSVPQNFLTSGDFEVIRRETAAARGIDSLNPTTEIITLRQQRTRSPITEPAPSRAAGTGGSAPVNPNNPSAVGSTGIEQTGLGAAMAGTIDAPLSPEIRSTLTGQIISDTRDAKRRAEAAFLRADDALLEAGWTGPGRWSFLVDPTKPIPDTIPASVKRLIQESRDLDALSGINVMQGNRPGTFSIQAEVAPLWQGFLRKVSGDLEKTKGLIRIPLVDELLTVLVQHPNVNPSQAHDIFEFGLGLRRSAPQMPEDIARWLTENPIGPRQ